MKLKNVYYFQNKFLEFCSNSEALSLQVSLNNFSTFACLQPLLGIIVSTFFLPNLSPHSNPFIGDPFEPIDGLDMPHVNCWDQTLHLDRY